MERAELIRLLGVQPALAEPKPYCLVEERDQTHFMGSFGRALAEGNTVFLCDPAWGATERAQLAALLNSEPKTLNSKPAPATCAGWLCLPTGGSSGQLKFARHDQDTISAAVQGFCAHFNVSSVNAVGVLPLHHVSGFMSWMRCALTGGRYLPWEWKRLEAGETPALPAGGEWFLSLVPTQLQRLLTQPAAVDWLRGFRAVFLGGGPAWPGLLEAAAAAQLPISLSYGLTETAAMVAALRPEEFLAGARDSGVAMPHAQIGISSAGLISVRAGSLFRGYFPGWREDGPFETGDVGQLDARGHLTVLGRSDAVIISGGKKIAPGEIEAALRATGRLTDVAVVGLPDTEWGQIVVACFPASQGALDQATLEQELSRHLAAYKLPKRYVPVDPWPRNEHGKVNRAALLSALNAQL